MRRTLRRGKLVKPGHKLPEEMVLEMTKEVMARIEEVRDWAAAHPVPYEEVYRLYEAYKATGVSRIPPPESRLTIPQGFRVAYGHELSSKGTVLHRVCVVSPGEVPPQAAIGVIMKAFGFVNPPVNCKIWMNPVSEGRYAVNVLEPLDGDWRSLMGATVH
jgi:hypothetical protein